WGLWDVLLHCIVDVILGKLGLLDFGKLFPDNDPKWKGAPSVFIIEDVRTKGVGGGGGGDRRERVVMLVVVIT
ncbi:2-C-methyl-D-erythritol 2 4-cyclodiphosphate synthase chloroplastic, partial [Bienertia sinuspersici]